MPAFAYIYNPTAGGGGGGTIGGTIAANEIGYGSALNALTSDANATRIAGGQFQTFLGSITYALGGDDQSNLSPNGVYKADNVGNIGNSISLVFNGTTDTYASVLATWNAANPSNTATLIKGNGSDVPDAQTLTFAGGGNTGYGAGTLDIGITNDFQGAGNLADDGTVVAFQGVGNIAGLTGTSELQSIMLGFSSAGISGGFFSPEQVNIINTDSSTYQADLRLDSSGMESGFNGKKFFSDNSSNIGWEDQGGGNTYYLPTTGTSSTNDVLAVTGISGSTYTLGFIPQSTGSGTIMGTIDNQQVAFGTALDTIGGSSDFTWDSAMKHLHVLAGPGGNNYLDLSGGGAISASTPGNSFLAGDVGGTHNRLLMMADDGSSVFSVAGDTTYATPTPMFVGTGANNFTPIGVFTGSGTHTYVVAITGENDQLINYTPTLGTVNVGDTLTGNQNGSTGLVVYAIGTDAMVEVTSGDFATETSFSGTGGTTGSINNVQVTDAYSLNIDSFLVLTNYPCVYANITSFLDGVSGSFFSATGHITGDNWTYVYSPTFGGSMLNLSGIMHTMVLGTPLTNITVNGNGTGTTPGQVTINALSSWSIANFFSVRNPSNSTQHYIDAGWNSGHPFVDLGGNGDPELIIHQSGYNFSSPLFNINSIPYVFPSFQGGAGTALTNDGSGNLSWSTAQSSAVSGDLTGQTGAVTTVATVTSPNDGSKHTYSLGAYLNITAVTLDVVQEQVIYTDENGTSQTESFFPSGLTSGGVGTVGNFPMQTMNIRVNPNTAVTVKTILTTGTGSIAYDVGGTIQLLK